jgi:hypothetical protein
MTIKGELQLLKMDGKEVQPGIVLIGEPSVVDGKLRCLANCFGALCLVELSLALLPTERGEGGHSSPYSVIGK